MFKKDLYFITGFLGAGKTTFMRNLIHELRDKKLHVIINEFGEVGVDGKLLKSLGVALDEINNGSILCSCRMDQFASVLDKAVKQDSQVIIIESSGLTDPSNLVKVLKQFNFTEYINYKGCICLVDAKRFHKVFETAIVVKKQLYAADYIIINKSDLVDSIGLEKVKNSITSIRPDIIINNTTFGQFEKDWFCNDIIKGLYEKSDFIQMADITLRKYLIKIDNETSIDMLKKFINMFVSETYRIKGFIRLEEKTFYLDCVGAMFKMEEYQSDNIEKNNLNKIVVLSGKGMDTKSAIKNAIKMYPMSAIVHEQLI